MTEIRFTPEQMKQQKDVEMSIAALLNHGSYYVYSPTRFGWEHGEDFIAREQLYHDPLSVIDKLGIRSKVWL